MQTSALAHAVRLLAAASLIACSARTRTAPPETSRRPPPRAPERAHAAEATPARTSSGGWARVASPLGAEEIRGVSGAGEDCVWIMSLAGMARWEGAAWSRVPGGPFADRDSPAPTAVALWVAARDDVWAARDGSPLGVWAFHWNGSQWTATRLPRSVGVLALGGSAPDDVWAVGDSGIVSHWDGQQWSASPSDATDALLAIYAASRRDAWMVGNNFAWGRWDGRAWRTQAYGPGAFVALAGTGPDDVWAAGQASAPERPPPAFMPVPLAPFTTPAGAASFAIQHWDGRTWSVSPTAPAETVNGIAARAPDDAWATGGAGHVWHWDGARWSPSDTGCDVSLGPVWTGGSGTWIGGAQGTLLYHAP